MSSECASHRRGSSAESLHAYTRLHLRRFHRYPILARSHGTLHFMKHGHMHWVGVWDTGYTLGREALVHGRALQDRLHMTRMFGW
jgi:hypothetical protein